MTYVLTSGIVKELFSQQFIKKNSLKISFQACACICLSGNSINSLVCTRAVRSDDHICSVVGFADMFLPEQRAGRRVVV